MSIIKLNAVTREILGKENRTIRKNNAIPAVIYGPKAKNRNLSLAYLEFVKAFDAAGQSSLIDLSIDGAKAAKVLVQTIAKDPLSGRYAHIDFYELDMNKELNIEVELEFIGISPAVKDKGGELIKTLDKIEVKCLPQNLVKTLQIDISALKEIGDNIYVHDIALPSGLELVTAGNLMVVAAEEIREEVFEAPPVAAPTAEETETIKEGEDKKEKEGTEPASKPAEKK